LKSNKNIYLESKSEELKKSNYNMANCKINLKLEKFKYESDNLN
jgi:hypothetical protein